VFDQGLGQLVPRLASEAEATEETGLAARPGVTRVEQVAGNLLLRHERPLDVRQLGHRLPPFEIHLGVKKNRIPEEPMRKAILVDAVRRRGDYGKRGTCRRASSSTVSPLIRSASETRRSDLREAYVLGTLLWFRKRIPFSPKFLWREPRKPVLPEVFVAKTRKTRTTLLRATIHP
jgi:hypothetical protein